MARFSKSLEEAAFLTAALEGLELQRARIEAQIAEVKAMLGGKRPKATEQEAEAPAPKRQLSSAARKRIAAAQKRRWAEFRKKKKSGEEK